MGRLILKIYRWQHLQRKDGLRVEHSPCAVRFLVITEEHRTSSYDTAKPYEITMEDVVKTSVDILVAVENK